jgi:glycosyltransferase involved in cell wall biosynthesis
VSTATDIRTRAKTLVVIPALNEQECIGAVISALLRDMPDVDVVVIDDGSTDDTSAVAQAAGAQVVQLPFNLGVGGALRAGLKFARRNGYERVVQVDADGQHDASHITDLLAALDTGAALAVGSRFTEDAGEYAVGRTRRLAMVILSRMVSTLLGQRIHDTTSGFRAFGPAAIALLADRYPRDYLSDTVETLLIVGYRGHRITEVPVQMHDRAGGLPSARNLKLAYHYLRMVLVIGATISFNGRRSARHLERSS